MTMFLAIFFSSFVQAKDLTVKYSDGEAKYTAQFTQAGVELESVEFNFAIKEQPCSRQRISLFKKKIEKLATKQKFKTLGKFDPATLSLNGVVTKIPRGDLRTEKWRQMPFALFALRQATDRLCKKNRKVASEQIPEVIEKLQKGPNSPGSKECENCPTIAGKDSLEEAQKCIAALCPNEKYSFKALTARALVQDPLKDPVYLRKYRPLVDNILRLEKNLAEKRNEMLRQIIAGKTFSDPTELALIEWMKAAFDVPLDAFDVDSQGYQKLNVPILKKLRPDWSVERVEASRKALEFLGKSYAEAPFHGQPLDRLMQMYPPEAVRYAVGSYLTTLKDQWSQVPDPLKKIAGIKGAQIENDIKKFEVLLTEGNLPNDVLYKMRDDFRMIYYLLKLEKPASDSPVNSSTAFSTLQESLTKNLIEPSNLVREEPTEIHEACAASYASIKYYSPDDSTIAALKKDERGFIDLFLKNIAGLLSKSSFDKIKEDSSRWHFAFAPKASEALNNFKNTLSAEASDLEAQLKYQASNVTAFDLFMLVVPEGTGRSVLEETCGGASRLMRDSAFKDNRAVYISPIVAKFWPMSEQVVNHELGHLLYYVMADLEMSGETKGKLAKIQSCLRETNPGESMDAESKHHEEDWGDFAANVADEHGSPAHSCLFLRDVAPQKLSAHLTLKNPDPMDTHSGDFFRALKRFFDINRGKLPESCVSLLQSKGETPSFRDCRPNQAIQ